MKKCRIPGLKHCIHSWSFSRVWIFHGYNLNRWQAFPNFHIYKPSVHYAFLSQLKTAWQMKDSHAPLIGFLQWELFHDLGKNWEFEGFHISLYSQHLPPLWVVLVFQAAKTFTTLFIFSMLFFSEFFHALETNWELIKVFPTTFTFVRPFSIRYYHVFQHLQKNQTLSHILYIHVFLTSESFYVLEKNSNKAFPQWLPPQDFSWV